MLYGHMRRPLLAAALCATACASGCTSTPPTPPQEPSASSAKKTADDWSCFGMRFNLGYDGLQTSMCQKPLAKCEASAESTADIIKNATVRKPEFFEPNDFLINSYCLLERLLTMR